MVDPVCSVRSARQLSRADHPSVPGTAVLEAPIMVGPPDADAAAATLVGFLSDMPTGSSLAEYLDPIILAFEDAIREGRLRTPVQLVASHVVGLPTLPIPRMRQRTTSSTMCSGGPATGCPMRWSTAGSASTAASSTRRWPGSAGRRRR